MKKRFILILAMALLISFMAGAFAFGEGNHITREQFFNSIVKAVGLEDEASWAIDFPDKDKVSNEYAGAIAAGVNAGYIFGRTDGTLDPLTELTIEDVDYVLSRLDFKPKVETEYITKYVDTVKYVSIPVPVMVGACKPEEGYHVYHLDADGIYRCGCEEALESPVGTVKLLVANSVESEIDQPLPSEPDESWWQFRADNCTVCNEEGISINVACNAKCFDIDGNEISFADMFKKYDAMWCKIKFLSEEQKIVDKYDTEAEEQTIDLIYKIEIAEVDE